MDNSYRPRGWTPKEVPTIWLDHATGQGVTREGTSVRPKVGSGRKNPNLTDLLDTAASYGAERIMLTGKRPEPAPGVRHWLYVQTPNWVPGTHWVAGGPPTGRFQHAVTGQKIEVRTVEEWFGDVPLTPAQARMAWNTLEEIIAGVDERARLMLSPAATGTNLWAWSLPKNVNPIPVSADMAAELHGTSGQHHLEHLVAGPSFSEHEDCVPLIDPKQVKKIQTFAHTDGRFMYASLGRELGIGPGLRLNRAGAYALLENEPYARARYFVRFTVPRDWNHVGLFGVRHMRVEDGWYYPNRPGAVGETWADSSEVFVARNAGWLVEPLEAVQFTRAKPLDTFFERMKRARDRVQENPDMPPMLRAALASALRAILLYTVGNFASAGRAQTRVAESAFDVPPEYQGTMVRQGKLFIYQVPSTVTERTRMFYHRSSRCKSGAEAAPRCSRARPRSARAPRERWPSPGTPSSASTVTRSTPPRCRSGACRPSTVAATTARTVGCGSRARSPAASSPRTTCSPATPSGSALTRSARRGPGRASSRSVRTWRRERCDVAAERHRTGAAAGAPRPRSERVRDRGRAAAVAPHDPEGAQRGDQRPGVPDVAARARAHRADQHPPASAPGEVRQPGAGPQQGRLRRAHRRAEDTGGRYTQTRQGGRLRTTTYLGGGGRQHELQIPKGRAAKGRQQANVEILQRVRGAARGQARDTQQMIKARVTYANGRVMEVKEYNASTMLKRINDHGGDALSWFRDENGKRYTNLDVSEQPITGVTMTVYGKTKTTEYDRQKARGRTRRTQSGWRPNY